MLNFCINLIWAFLFDISKCRNNILKHITNKIEKSAIINFETSATGYWNHNNLYGHLHLHKSLQNCNFQSLYKLTSNFQIVPMLNISSHELIIWRQSGDYVIIFTRLLGSPIDSRSFSLDLILLFSKTLKSHSFLFAPVSPVTFHEQMITFTFLVQKMIELPFGK